MTISAGGVTFDRVSKHFGPVKAVDEVSFTIEPNTLVTLLGPSGCGKTTILRMAAGLETASGGRVLIGGHDVTNLAASERNVSLVFQSYALFPHMNVLDNVCYGPISAKVEKGRARELAHDKLTMLGLEGLEARLPSELSGGQQQRVAVARALVLEPAVLLFDEPLSNLDARLRRSMREEIRSLQQRLQLTVAYVTHDQAEALAVSDQIIVMDQGTIAQAGPPDALYERPTSAFVAGFMGEALLFDGESLADGSVRLGPLVIRPPNPLGAGAVKVAVRPEAWEVCAEGAAPLAGVAVKSAYLGSTHEYTFDTELGPVFVVSPAASRLIAPGERVSLALARHGVSVVAA